MHSLVKNLTSKLKTLSHVHYITNVLLASSYFLTKNLPVVCDTLYESCVLEWRELEILMLLCIFVAVKTRKAATWLQFFSSMCTFSKAANIILYWREGPVHVIAFSLLWFLHFVFLPQPVYKGPQNVAYFRGAHLENEIKRDDRITWLVCFYASWSSKSNDFAPVFAELSNKYGDLDNFKFVKFDCNLFPEFAKKFSINTTTFSKQLPTLVMFQKGQEVKRRPFVDSKGQIFDFIFSYDNVAKDFDLNRIYYECKKNPIVVKPSAKPNQEKKDD
jgi:thiol-disulfide isomerase/thioredoxin